MGKYSIIVYNVNNKGIYFYISGGIIE